MKVFPPFSGPNWLSALQEIGVICPDSENNLVKYKSQKKGSKDMFSCLDQA